MRPQSQQKKQSNNRNKVGEKEGLAVYDPNVVYFNNYVEIYLGAKWQDIKGSLYDAGYTTSEVSTYRDKQINEFYEICNRNSLFGII